MFFFWVPTIGSNVCTLVCKQVMLAKVMHSILGKISGTSSERCCWQTWTMGKKTLVTPCLAIYSSIIFYYTEPRQFNCHYSKNSSQWSQPFNGNPSSLGSWLLPLQNKHRERIRSLVSNHQNAYPRTRWSQISTRCLPATELPFILMSHHNRFQTLMDEPRKILTVLEQITPLETSGRKNKVYGSHTDTTFVWPQVVGYCLS